MTVPVWAWGGKFTNEIFNICQIVIKALVYLEGVGPIDNRPSTKFLYLLVKKNWTHDIWHVTYDRWEEVNLLLKCQLPSSYHLVNRGDMWHLTCDTWHITPDIWYLTCDNRHTPCVMRHTEGNEKCVKISNP